MREACCNFENINDLDNAFDRARAEKEARAYLDTGAGKRIDRLLAHLKDRLGGPASVLDIGCGVGGAHFELLRAGLARQVVGVEASSGYVAAGQQIADELGMAGQVRYVQADFAQAPQEFEPADVVIMDRVVCCYPHLEPLLDPAAGRTQRYLVLSYPREVWWNRIFHLVVNGLRRIRKSDFFTYLHPHAEIERIARRNGLSAHYSDRFAEWQITVFARPQAS